MKNKERFTLVLITLPPIPPAFAMTATASKMIVAPHSTPSNGSKSLWVQTLSIQVFSGEQSSVVLQEIDETRSGEDNKSKSKDAFIELLRAGHFPYLRKAKW